MAGSALRRWPARYVLATLACLSGAAGADAGAPPADTDTVNLSPVVVTATRVGEDPFDVPASISAVSAADLNDNKLGVNLSESMNAVPGILVRDRQDYAQDQQLSIRGFGARAQFGIVGVRLFVDGVPATMPDGQGQASHFNLDSADRIEVLRGPFSALYGNASGGVVQIFTADGTEPPQLDAELVGGSDNSWRESLMARGVSGALGYTLDYTHFSTSGYRDHSAARRDSGNAKLSYRFADGNRLTLVANTVSIPEAQDEGGLTRAQFEADPAQAAPVALQYNTRKSTAQTQAGLIDELPLGDGQSLRLTGYYGHRIVKQFLSVPPSAQASPTSAGGVVDLHNAYYGGDARWIAHALLLDRPLTVVAGLSYDRLDSRRRGYENFISDSSGQELGVQGDLRRNEENALYAFDQYAQADWRFAQRWSAFVGVRHSQVDFDSQDHYITASNPDDSGRAAFSATTPVAGLMFRASQRLHLYADYGQGFDTPTFDNLAYKPDGSSGLNLALQPARTGNGELGAKWKLRQATLINLALFRSITRDELAVATSSGGRSTYQNAGRTRRQGVEAEIDAALGGRWHWQLAYTYLDAQYRQTYLTCTGTPCKTPTTPIDAGNRIPGVPESDLYTALHWGADTGFNAALEASYLSKVVVNDTNSEGAPAYGLLGINGGYVWDLPRLRVKTFVRLDNLLDTAYVSAVVVDDGNGRYYQPGPGRSIYGGVAVTWRAPGA